MAMPRRARRGTDSLLCCALMTQAVGAFAPDYSSFAGTASRNNPRRRPPSFVPSRSARCSGYAKQSQRVQRGSDRSVSRGVVSVRTSSSSALGSVRIATSEISAATADVLSTSDVVIGTILAFVLAFGYSFLNGQSSSSNFISWRSQVLDSTDLPLTSLDDDMQVNATDKVEDKQVFDAEAWKDISRPENYVWYNSKIRDERRNEADAGIGNPDAKSNEEQKWVVIALLVLFVPIFSVEFFFALSRQFMCGGDVFTQPGWAQQLCSPYLGR